MNTYNDLTKENKALFDQLLEQLIKQGLTENQAFNAITQTLKTFNINL